MRNLATANLFIHESLAVAYQPEPAAHFEPERTILTKGSLDAAPQRQLTEAICALYPQVPVVEKLDLSHNRVDPADPSWGELAGHLCKVSGNPAGIRTAPAYHARPDLHLLWGTEAHGEKAGQKKPDLQPARRPKVPRRSVALPGRTESIGLSPAHRMHTPDPTCPGHRPVPGRPLHLRSPRHADRHRPLQLCPVRCPRQGRLAKA